MRTLHFDCFSGISGDMTLAALFDAGADVEVVRRGLESLGLPIQLHVEKIRKGGFAATQVKIDAPHEHKHRHLHHIEEILKQGQLTDRQYNLAMRIFRKLAEAEAAAHGLPIEKVHFHEVGALDSIADITGAAIALDVMEVDRITSSSVPTGTGTVKCEHGIMPIPAPGTAQLLKGVPLRPSTIAAELTTPTGAAILTTVVEQWTETPALTIEQIGCGAGQKDFAEQPNILRVFVGEATDVMAIGGYDADSIWVLETNLDDVSAEIMGYCFDKLFATGALDVFAAPVVMKKNRPGTLLSVLAPELNVQALEDVLFQETTTLGVRRYRAQRHMLHRQRCTVTTPWGNVQGKLAWRGDERPRFSPEHDHCVRLAQENNVPLREIYRHAEFAYLASQEQS